VIKQLDDGRADKLLDAYRAGGTKTQGDFESFQKRLLIDLAPAENGKQTRADRLQVELNLDKTITVTERDKLQLLIDQLRVQDLALLAKKSEREGQQVIIGLEKDFHNELEKRQDALNAPLLSASERQLAEDLRAVAKRAQDARIELEKLQVSGSLSAADLDRRLQQVNSDEQAQKDAITALKIEQDKMNASWEYGANVALRSYMDEIANVAKQSESAMTRAFRGMEEALVNFVKTGKLDFKSLADSIISDLIRMQVQQSIMKPLTSAIESAGGIGGILGSIFGTSSGSSAGATSSSTISQYSLASGASSFGLQVPAFATGIDYVPRDMIAQIHKGERITRAVDNRPGFGGNITVNVTGSNADTVRRAAGQGAREALIMFNRAGRYL
jgi:lambda family phage tail tape measure protein